MSDKITNNKTIDRRISVAPMMGWTDRHDRYFLRLISPNVLLYTVMITTGALIHGDIKFHMEYSPEENPLALQLGGSDPKDLAKSAKIAENYGYDEVNINCGCPSDRVKKGSFGACLMKSPEIVADCVDAMMQEVDIPITVKNRIGVDEQESYQELVDFTGVIADKGCDTFIVHARKAWLNGLSPKENRTIPPLKWDWVIRLKKDFPDLNISLNGGITNMDHITENLGHVDGIMIGREAYQNPYFLAEIEKQVFNNAKIRTRHEVIQDLIPYIDRELKSGEVKLKDITRHILGLFQGQKGTKKFKRILSEEAYKPDANSSLILKALEAIEN